jgi:hypothetical protein
LSKALRCSEPFFLDRRPESGKYFGTKKSLALAARIRDTPNMNSYKLVTPQVVTRISQNEFARSFRDLLPEIESGTIFRVSGNPAIEAINRNFVQPARAERRLKDFRPDTPPSMSSRSSSAPWRSTFCFRKQP